jgi:phenolic acid decarboxylase
MNASYDVKWVCSSASMLVACFRNCHVRLADEYKQKCDELEDLYKKLLEKQKDTCVIGVPDRPGSPLP